jgi:hypothetical protein
VDYYALHLGRPERDPGLLLLSLWAPDSGGHLDLRRRELNVSGASWRGELGGWGVLTLQLGGMMPDGVQPSYVNVNSEKRALLWEDADRNLGPVAHDAGRPILEHAAAVRRTGTSFRNH